MCTLISLFTRNWALEAPDISAFRMSIGNFSRFVLEAPDASTSQRVVFPRKVIELAPLVVEDLPGSDISFDEGGSR